MDLSTVSSDPHMAQTPVEGAAISCVVPHAAQLHSAGISDTEPRSEALLKASLVCTIQSNMVFLPDAPSGDTLPGLPLWLCSGSSEHFFPWLLSEVVCTFRKLPDHILGA